MDLKFTNDEMILTLVSLVRAIDPRILKSSAEGFTLDFPPLPPGAEMSFDEKLARGLCMFLETEPKDGNYRIEFSPEEANRLSDVLESLVEKQKWPDDVKSMSRAIRKKLSEVDL